MLVARSPEESQLYIELHPCECGDDNFEWSTHHLRQDGAALVSTYSGECPGCARQRHFEFALHPDPPPPPPAFGPANVASQIIDPGEFLTVSRTAAGTATAQPQEVRATERERSRYALEFAVAALEEVLKFIPPGADSVPVEATTSERSRSLYAVDPGQFHRVRIDAVLKVYREIIARHDAVAASDIS